jgi:AraC-like DNA-binding protein
MHQEINQQRLKNVNEMLLEMAAGNFSYQIPRTENDDELEVLTLLINWLAQEIKEGVFHLGYINPHGAYHYVVQSTFVLDLDFTINDFSNDIPNLLGLEPSKILGKKLDEILAPESVPVWKIIKGKFKQGLLHYTTLPLVFITSEKLIIDTFCSVSKLIPSGLLMVSSFKAARVEQENIIGQEKETYNELDVKLIQAVYDYVLEYNGASFPTLQELARIFGTNENKLKVGFRYLFKTSIYQLYNNQRLERSLHLIQHTNIPLKNIALMIGFSTHSSFSRAFKIKYGYPPTHFERKSSSKSDNPML